MAGIKGKVSLLLYRENLYRLRWSLNGNRYALYTTERAKALKAKTLIESDIKWASFDNSIERYRKILQSPGLEGLPPSKKKPPIKIIAKKKELGGKSIIKLFEQFMRLCGIEDGHNGQTYTKKMLVKWGDFHLNEIVLKLKSENYSARTYNERRHHLKSYFSWLSKNGYTDSNPLEFSKPMRQRKQSKASRKPFTEEEVKLILEALKNNTYSSKNNNFPHSQYYDFVLFFVATGARNAEGVGLKIEDINFQTNEIHIWRSLARTTKGSHPAARILKSTKNDKERYLPFDPSSELSEMLVRLCYGRNPDEFVFVNKNGNPIDDRMFQRRVFKPLLKDLGIKPRDFYALRHTFATKAVRQGMLAHHVAYLMGDSIVTVLKNYFHNDAKPRALPL